MTEEAERAKFEVWMRSVRDAGNVELLESMLRRDGGGNYIQVPTHSAWTAWKARAKLDQPSGYSPYKDGKFVP